MLIISQLVFSQVLDDPVELLNTEKVFTHLDIDNYLNVFAYATIIDNKVFVGYSLDYGASWSSLMKVNEESSHAVAIEITDNKEIYVFYIECIEAQCFLKMKKCSNNCTIWSEETQITDHAIKHDKPSIKYKNGSLYILYAEAEENSSLIVFNRSDDGGANWNNKKVLNKNINDSNSDQPMGWKSDFFVSDDGRIYAAWIEGSDFFSIAFSKSHNNGKTFSHGKLIQKVSLIPDCSTCSIYEQYTNSKLFKDESRLYLFFIKTLGSDSDLYVMLSENEGGNWETPKKLTQGFSFIYDYSIKQTNDKFYATLFRKDKEIEAIYYSEIDKSNIDYPIHLYLIDNNRASFILLDELERIYLLFPNDEELLQKTILLFARLSMEVSILGDDDKDGIPDNFEQQILDKFRPIWKINNDDTSILPVQMVPGCHPPQWSARNGTIYGEVLNRGYCVTMICDCDSCRCTGFHIIEAHFFDIWAEDNGCVFNLLCKHVWDKEHVSARIVYAHSVPSMDDLCETNWHPPNENLWNINNWHADSWLFFAHEGTICDKTNSLYGNFSSGPIAYISRKHGAFKSENKCNQGNCCDSCYSPYLTISSYSPINVGQPIWYLNGACWTGWDAFLTAQMDPEFSRCTFKDNCLK